MGVTLTLSRNAGNLLIAFATTFISLVSARFWHILCIVFHRYYSTPEPRDVLYYQCQAILRNSASFEVGLWKLL
jgi:hypothetical protein